MKGLGEGSAVSLMGFAEGIRHRPYNFFRAIRLSHNGSDYGFPEPNGAGASRRKSGDTAAIESGGRQFPPVKIDGFGRLRRDAGSMRKHSREP